MVINATNRSRRYRVLSNGTRVDVVGGGGTSYTPTVIVTNQTELNTELAKTAAQLEGQVIGVQYNATAYSISRTQLRKNYGAGGLVITQYGATKPVFSAVAIENCTNFTLHSVEVSDPSATGERLVGIYTGSTNITVSGCVIHGTYYDPNGDYAAGFPGNADGVQCVSNGTGSVGDVLVTGCTIYDCAIGVQLNYASATSNWEVTQNTIYRSYSDNIKVSVGAAPASVALTWNVLSQVFAKGSDAGNPHADHIQFIGGSVDVTGIVINGNIIFKGESRGSGQGIFLDDTIAGKFFTATIKGNLVSSTFVRGISIHRAKNCTIVGNTVAAGDIGQEYNATIHCGEGEDGSGNVVKNCVATNFATSGATTTNNHTATQTTGGYSALFNGTSFSAVPDLDSRSKMLAAFAMKVGGALDQTVNIGAAGSGYVDFDARTLNGAME